MKKNYVSLKSRLKSVFNLNKNFVIASPPKGLFVSFATAAALFLVSGNAVAQTNVANYSFAKTTGATYTPITGGTVVASGSYDNTVSSAIAFSTPFPFGGTTVSTCYISANGFITFGAAPAGTNYTPLSTVGSTTGAISAFGQDGGTATGSTTSEIRYEDLGTEFVVQFTDHANYYNSATEKLNFQIRLNYATGAINIVYGLCTDPGTASTTSTTPQVGIRGNSSTFATNMSPLMIGNIPAGTTCDWSKAVTGNANSSTMLFSGTTNGNVKIPLGLQYTWTPGTQLPVRTFSATTGVTNTGAVLTWTAPTGATSYNVQYRTAGSCDWTDFSGNPVSATTATLAGLAQSTTYHVQVQALNGTAQSIYSHIPNAAGTGNGYVTAGSFTTLANCSSTVTGLASSAIALETATISWTASTTAPANGYEYYYSTSSTAPTSTATPSGSVGAGVTTANLSGLAPGTQYYYWVRTNCNGIDKGAWSSSANFTTLSLCATVTLPVANATGVSTTPTITWNTIAGATGYKVRIGTTSGGNDVVDADVTGGATTYSVTTPLNNATKYYYTVSGYTATASAVTTCSVRNFTTVCTSISTLPWTENFDAMGSAIGSGIFPACWGQTQGTKSWVSANASFTTVNDPKSTPNYVVIPWSNTSASYLWTPGFQLTAGISYDFVFNFTGDGSTGWTGDVVQNSSQSSTGATNLGASFITSTTSSVASYAKVTRTFVPTADGVYYFGVKVTSASAPNYLGVDDFSLMVTPTCVEPTAVTISNISASSGDISWTASTTVPANGYDVYYSTSNTAPTSSTVLNTTNSVHSTSLTATIPGLNDSTTYYVWVRSNCSTTDQSVWTSMTSFTTLCSGFANVPYTLNFEGVTNPALPVCTSNENVGTGNNWITSSTNGASYGFTTNALNYVYHSSNPANTWFYTRGINLDATKVYTISYKYGGTGTSFVEKLKVAYGTSPSSTSMTNAIADYPSVTNATPNSVSIDFTPPTTGAYYFGFNAYSIANRFYLFVDDISIVEKIVLGTSETSQVKSNNIKVYPNPFTEVLNISDIDKVKTVVVTDASGRVVKTIDKPEAQLYLADLNSGMYLVTLRMKDGTVQTVKAIKK